MAEIYDPASGTYVQDFSSGGADMSSPFTDTSGDVGGTSGGASFGPPSQDSGGGGSVSSANWGTIFSSIGTSVASVYKSVTQPSVGVINPRTGQPYTQAQLSTLAQQNASMGGFNIGGLLPIALVVIVAVLILRK